jgi:hypothetical protein
MKYFIRHSGNILAVLLLSAAGSASYCFATVETFTDESSGLISWKAQHPGFSLQFIQLLPDYVLSLKTSQLTCSATGLPTGAISQQTASLTR